MGYSWKDQPRNKRRMPEHFYVYPSYLTAKSRADGRRVSGKIVIPKSGELTLEDMVTATKKLGFEAVSEEKNYPRASPSYQGRIKVTKKKGVKKAAFLRDLAQELVRSRSTQ